MSKNVRRILSALQIGDISRQRAEHVQSGLALIDGGDQSASALRLKAAGELLLGAQLEAALRDYDQQVANLLPSIEGLASDALALAALSDAVTDLGEGGHDLRDLKRRMDGAIQLVAEIQAADGAARYLAGRLATPTGASAGTEAALGRHPLDQKAAAFLDRITYMEAAADDCIGILERLKEASEALIADRPATAQPSEGSPKSQPASPKGLAAAAARIKAIRSKAEDDIAVHAGKNTDILRLLDEAASPPHADEPDDELVAGSYTGLKFTSADLDPDDDAFTVELNVLLSKIEALYTMPQERVVQRAFSKACGLKVAQVADAIEDGLF
jgi:hypothetical protein